MTGPRIRPSEVWDRFFWSFMVVVFVSLLWMKYLQDHTRFEDGGYWFSFAVGALWFWRGVRKIQRASGTDTPKKVRLRGGSTR